MPGHIDANLANSQATDEVGLNRENPGKSKPVSGKNRKHFLKTELCRFFPRCNKGEDCPFAHAHAELKAQTDLTKSALCTSWRRGRCPHDAADCKFAHGAWDLRDPYKAAGTSLLNRRRDNTRSTSKALPVVPMGDSINLEEQLTAELATAGTRTPSGTTTASDTQSDCGSDKPGDIPSRQASAFTDIDFFDTMSRQVSFDGPSRQGMTRQISLDGGMGMDGGFSRQVSFESAMSRQGMSRQVSFDGGFDGAMNRQVTPVAMMAMAPNGMVSQGIGNEKHTLQVPVMIKMGTFQMPVLAAMTNMSPKEVTETQSQIEKALLAAAPAQYED